MSVILQLILDNNKATFPDFEQYAQQKSQYGTNRLNVIFNIPDDKLWPN